MRTPIHSYHRQHARRMVDFHGWEMPLYFDGIVKEHRTVRTSVGFFDVSHMGKILLHGLTVATRFRDVIPGKLPTKGGICRYTHLLRDDGTILDDVILTCLSSNQYLCICNAGARNSVLAFFETHLGQEYYSDLTTELVCLALQGREAEATLQPLVMDTLSDLRPFRGLGTETRGRVPVEAEGWAPLSVPLTSEIDDNPQALYLTRTGYTGEDGFEIFASNGLGKALWARLVEEGGISPVGLGARDTLRLEKGYLLSGQDFDGSQTPLQVGYERLIDWDHDFVGRDALSRQKEAGGYERLMGIRLAGRGVPRSGQRIWHKGRVVGRLTSGTISPTLGVGIGLGYLEPSAAREGTEVGVEIRQRHVAARVTKPPFL